MWSAERINPDRQDTKPFALQTTADTGSYETE